jgi:hypothetical protein
MRLNEPKPPRGSYATTGEIMKTVQLMIYRPWGTNGGYCVDLHYRGKLLTGFMSTDLAEARANALIYAKNRGFTHTSENLHPIIGD